MHGDTTCVKSFTMVLEHEYKWIYHRWVRFRLENYGKTYSTLLTYRETTAHTCHAGRPGTLPGTDPRGRDHRWLISKYALRTTSDKRYIVPTPPNKSRRWKYKTRLYDHNYFGPVPATPRKHADFYTRSQQYSRGGEGVRNKQVTTASTPDLRIKHSAYAGSRRTSNKTDYSPV